MNSNPTIEDIINGAFEEDLHEDAEVQGQDPLEIELADIKADYADFGPEGFYQVPFKSFCDEFPEFSRRVLIDYLQNYAETELTPETIKDWKKGELIYDDDWYQLFKHADRLVAAGKDTEGWKYFTPKSGEKYMGNLKGIEEDYEEDPADEVPAVPASELFAEMGKTENESDEAAFSLDEDAEPEKDYLVVPGDMEVAKDVELEPTKESLGEGKGCADCDESCSKDEGLNEGNDLNEGGQRLMYPMTEPFEGQGAYRINPASKNSINKYLSMGYEIIRQKCKPFDETYEKMLKKADELFNAGYEVIVCNPTITRYSSTPYEVIILYKDKGQKDEGLTKDKELKEDLNVVQLTPNDQAVNLRSLIKACWDGVDQFSMFASQLNEFGSQGALATVNGLINDFYIAIGGLEDELNAVDPKASAIDATDQVEAVVQVAPQVAQQMAQAPIAQQVVPVMLEKFTLDESEPLNENVEESSDDLKKEIEDKEIQKANNEVEKYRKEKVKDSLNPDPEDVIEETSQIDESLGDDDTFDPHFYESLLKLED